MDRWHRSTWATVIGDRKKETERGRKEKVCRTTEYTNSDQKGKKKNQNNGSDERKGNNRKGKSTHGKASQNVSYFLLT